MVKKLKCRTSLLLQQEFPSLGKTYWGRHFWAVGYGAWSTGKITDEMVRNISSIIEKSLIPKRGTGYWNRYLEEEFHSFSKTMDLIHSGVFLMDRIVFEIYSVFFV